MGGGERGIVDGEGHCHWNELFKARRGRYGSSDDIIWGSEIKKNGCPSHCDDYEMLNLVKWLKTS